MKIFVEEKWIKGETCVFTISNQFDQIAVKNALHKMRAPFVEKLKSEGYTITTNRNEVDEDTICLIMNCESLIKNPKTIEEFKEALKQKIATSAGSNFHFPHSVTIEEYFNNPFFPAVFKNELQNGGKDKFLISTPEQVGIIKYFYEQNKDDKDIMEGFNNCIIQQFIETPTKYATYMRVLANGAGEVMGANLKCSKTDFEKSKLNSEFEKIFLDPTSKYYINATKMFNYYSGGLEIGLSQPKYSSDKQEILLAHGFNMDDLKLPEEVTDVVKNIMLNCNQEVGVMCGFDFILNTDDGHWYYLENQAFPAIEEWAKPKGITIPGSHNLKGYIRYNEIELQAREEALRTTISYRMQNKNAEKSPVMLTIKPPKENN
ncbi:MAG: hypothetical protein K2I70_00450, partial [Bacilli bacterium]|nr:hypothetical protein [Bacilli bacterium]